MTRKEIAEKLYDEKKRTGARITPIGRNTPLSKQEFVKRYLNGVGGIKGFKKEELQYLLEKESKKPTQRIKQNNKYKSEDSFMKQTVKTQKTTTKSAKTAPKTQNTAKMAPKTSVKPNMTNKSTATHKVENKRQKTNRSNKDDFDIKVTRRGNCYFNNKKVTNSKDQCTVKKIGKLMHNLDKRMK